MSGLPSVHLTADDLDAFLIDSPSQAAREHVAFCDACRSVVQADRVLVAALHGLPALAPADGFAERVMAQVRIAVPAPVVAPLPWPRRILSNRRVMASAATALGVWASAVWTASNSALFDRWTQQAWQTGTQWVTQSLQTMASMVTQQSWYGTVEALTSTPARAVLVVGALVATWAVGVLVLRRLVMLPAEPAADAAW